MAVLHTTTTHLILSESTGGVGRLRLGKMASLLSSSLGMGLKSGGRSGGSNHGGHVVEYNVDKDPELERIRQAVAELQEKGSYTGEPLEKTPTAIKSIPKLIVELERRAPSEDQWEEKGGSAVPGIHIVAQVSVVCGVHKYDREHDAVDAEPDERRHLAARPALACSAAAAGKSQFAGKQSLAPFHARSEHYQQQQQHRQLRSWGKTVREGTTARLAAGTAERGCRSLHEPIFRK